MRESQDAYGKPLWQLKEVGVGTSVEVQGTLRIITLENAQTLGVSLGLIKRQQLLENERQFQQLRVVAQTTTLLIFDAPAIVHRDGQHVDRIMRHLFWIEARSGTQGLLVWLLEDQQEGWVASDEPARLINAPKEQRVIHVDRSEFNLLGLPSTRAFALVDLPPGRDVPWLPETKAIAALPSYTLDQLRELGQGFNRSMVSPP